MSTCAGSSIATLAHQLTEEFEQRSDVSVIGRMTAADSD